MMNLLIANLLLLSVDPTPTSTFVPQFYAAYQKLHFSGLPNSKQLLALSPYLSPRLHELLRRAQAEQAKCIRKNPDDKGPWVEGDLFSSNFEGVTRVVLVSSDGKTNSDVLRQQLHVSFEYVENGQKVAWSDDLVLTRASATAAWLIDDVLYRGGQQFGSGFGSSLRRSLSEPGCPN